MRLTFVAMLVTPALLLALPAMALRREALAALPADRTTWDSVFTVEQAARGEIAYEATCAGCHQQSLSGAEGMSGGGRRDALSRLASELDGNANGSSDAARVRMLAGAVRDLATATR